MNVSENKVKSQREVIKVLKEVHYNALIENDWKTIEQRRITNTTDTIQKQISKE